MVPAVIWHCVIPYLKVTLALLLLGALISGVVYPFALTGLLALSSMSGFRGMGAIVFSLGISFPVTFLIVGIPALTGAAAIYASGERWWWPG